MVSSSSSSIGLGIGRRRADLHRRTFRRHGAKAKGPGKQSAVGVRPATGHALSARGGRGDTRVREAQSVAAASAQPGAVRGANARSGAPQSAAREARIACIALRGAGIADSRFAADAALRAKAGGEIPEETDPVGRLSLAGCDALGGAGAALLAVEQVLTIGPRPTPSERRATARRRALRALSVAGQDRAGTR